MTNLSIYQIQELVKDQMEYIADVKNTTANSITKNTGWGEDTRSYEVLSKMLKTIGMKGVKLEEAQQVHSSLMNIIAELED